MQETAEVLLMKETAEVLLMKESRENQRYVWSGLQELS
jgi:hypothetical protein